MTTEEVCDYQEVFLLQDKDEQGVLSLQQTKSAIILLGIRIGGKPIFSGQPLMEINILQHKS